jgi:hypothetical protein
MAKPNVLAQYPVLIPTESWGILGTSARRKVESYTRHLVGDTPGECIDNLVSFQDLKHNMDDTKGIVSQMILLHSLSALLDNFRDSSAGFVFESYLAALLKGERVVETNAKGNLPTEDILIGAKWNTYPVSVKLLKDDKKNSRINGSINGLLSALQKYDHITYLVVLKSIIGRKLRFIEFVIGEDNLQEILSLTTRSALLTDALGEMGEREGTIEAISELIKSNSSRLSPSKWSIGLKYMLEDPFYSIAQVKNLGTIDLNESKFVSMTEHYNPSIDRTLRVKLLNAKHSLHRIEEYLTN